MEYPIEIIKEKTNRHELNKFLDQPFKEVVKFVVDIEREVIAVGGEFHSDAAELLVKNGSAFKNLWGGNFYPLKSGKQKRIKYYSLINIKPSQEHFSIDIQNPEIIAKIKKIIDKLINNE